MYIRYQVIFTEQLKFKEELTKLFFEAFEFIQNVDTDQITNAISIEYIKKISDKWIVGFSFTWDYEIHDAIISKINQSLTHSDIIACVVKYYDEGLLNTLNKFYPEIFTMEMKIREIVTLIFAEKYDHCFYDFLREVDIKPEHDDKDIFRNKENRELYLKERLENEFFYLLFSDYINTLKRKGLSPDIIYNITQTANNFDEFKDYISNRGITKKEHQDFLSSIKNHLNIIETIRNCVAHNKTPPPDELIYYDDAMKQLNTKLDNFLDALKKETLIKYKKFL